MVSVVTDAAAAVAYEIPVKNSLSFFSLSIVIIILCTYMFLVCKNFCVLFAFLATRSGWIKVFSSFFCSPLTLYSMWFSIWLCFAWFGLVLFWFLFHIFPFSSVIVVEVKIYVSARVMFYEHGDSRWLDLTIDLPVCAYVFI